MLLIEAFLREPKKFKDVSLDHIKVFLHKNKNPNYNAIDLDLWDESIDRLYPKIGNRKNIMAYRAVSIVGDPYTYLDKRDYLGDAWTWDLESARVYRDPHHGYGDHFILTSSVQDSHVDWVRTIGLGMIPHRGTYENEVKLMPKEKVKLTNVLDDRKRVVSLTDSDVLNKSFKIV